MVAMLVATLTSGMSSTNSSDTEVSKELLGEVRRKCVVG